MSAAGGDLARIRRGLGLIFLLAGLIHAGEMVLAVLYSQGRLPIVIGAGLWSELYFAHFLFLVMGSLLYLALNFRSTGVFHHETLVDFLVGLGVFILLMSAAAHLLVRRLVAPWWSLAPSAFLACYGLFLTSGRGLFNRSAASPSP